MTSPAMSYQITGEYVDFEPEIKEEIKIWIKNPEDDTIKEMLTKLELKIDDLRNVNALRMLKRLQGQTSASRKHALSRLHEDESDEAQTASITIEEKVEDRWYKKLLTKVKADPSKYPYHKAVGSTLYHYRPVPFTDDVIDDQDSWKLIVPREKRQQVLFECHEEPTPGHLGRHKTYERLAMRYYWPSAHRDVTKYVRKCQICQQCKVQQLAPAGLMGRNPEIGHSVRHKEAEAALIAEEDEARIAWAMRMENLSGIRDKATENSQRAQERQARYYNKKRRDVTFKINDRVLRPNRILSSSVKGIAAKLGRKFRGPCRVSKVLGSNVYQLIGEKGELVEKFTASDLKPYYGKSSAAVSDERKSTTNDVTSDKLSMNSNMVNDEIATKAKITAPRKPRVAASPKSIKISKHKKTMPSKQNSNSKLTPTRDNDNSVDMTSATAPRLTRAQAARINERRGKAT
ncbi:hypothetical protein TKK_0002372 [Trichogramma kaykai]